MFSPAPSRFPLPTPGVDLDAFLDSLPQIPAVFLLDAGAGQQPYLSRTSNLKRRAVRLLRAREGTSRLLNLRGIAREIAWWSVPSALEASLILLEQARAFFPERYRRMLRLRLPTYVRVLRKNRFPRVIVSRQPGSPEFTFGPFLYRSHAEEFLDKTLDLFLLRRCEEDLEPSPDHPGCIYGEMGMCMRPCQAASEEAEYRRETTALVEFLATEGESLRGPLEAKRFQASENLEFEEAAKLHRRLQKVEEAWKPRNDFPRLLAQFRGVAVTPAGTPGEVKLWPVLEGQLQPPLVLPAMEMRTATIAAEWYPMESRRVAHPAEVRDELLAVVTRWRHSSWCDGEWVRFEREDDLPGRKIANAARRVAAGGNKNAAGNHRPGENNGTANVSADDGQ